MRSKRLRFIVYFAVFFGLAWAGWTWRAEIGEKAVYHIPRNPKPGCKHFSPITAALL